MIKAINIFLLLASTTCSLVNLEKELESVIWLNENLGHDLGALPFFTSKAREIMNRIKDSDPISLMERMAKMNSLEKMVFFWHHYGLVVKPKFKNGELLISKIDKKVIESVLNNFKYYVLEKALRLKGDLEENQVRFYDAAMNMCNIWMKKFSDQGFILYSLPKQYQLLIINDPISQIISEFYSLKRLLTNARLNDRAANFRIHFENFYLLIQYLTLRPDDLHGLIWVVNQSAQFIFLYLVFHKNPNLLDKCTDKKNFITYLTDLDNLRVMIIWSLSHLIPIFDCTFHGKSINIKFYDLSQYTNPVIGDNTFLESLVSEIVIKIAQVSIEDLLS